MLFFGEFTSVVGKASAVVVQVDSFDPQEFVSWNIWHKVGHLKW